MWYDINWNVFGIQMLPIKWRDSPTIAFVKVLLKPLDENYYTWHNWRIDNLYKLEYTGQICYLRGSLNDKFDPLQRRIYIGEGEDKPTTYIYTEAESLAVFTNTEAEGNEGTLYIYTEAETADSGLDFIVYIPFELLITQIYAIRAHIDFYKQGGRRYAIIGI